MDSLYSDILSARSAADRVEEEVYHVFVDDLMREVLLAEKRGEARAERWRGVFVSRNRALSGGMLDTAQEKWQEALENARIE